ncbi:MULTISPECIES: TfoX/Sxy family protein [unclassified Microbacterium]|uniref:TfoX/Sxy family protein n=1 Tax=unclassified Microbacterium TaxID=2609290 RepID=UPI00214CEC92|nr:MULTISPECIES: TfoX/Sxy family protein [unclassified Microbacterium]MCR2783953.1 TfoX/Sxy family protein [Microbacterium sp. zg.B96]WIM15203.1 TfoX/Sxy family protein [Microbacterium sp. zg-B96]
MRIDDRRALLDRIVRLLPGGSIREVAMFGAIAVMFDEAMLVAVNGDGSLLVRVAPEADAALLHRGGAARAEMGTGRSMGIGWIRVTGNTISGDAELALWLEHALRRRGRAVGKIGGG